MINYCILKKAQAGGKQAQSRSHLNLKNQNLPDDSLFHSTESQDFKDSENESDGGDIFYDMEEKTSFEEVSKKKADIKESILAQAKETKDVINYPDTEGREGYVKPLGEGKICQNGRLLFLPETQDPAPLTEDQLEEQQLMFEELGTNSEATKIRQRMQTAQLKSDMEAFKAANPGSILADFVQWHSPRDWIPPTAGAESTLSPRMLEEGNLWEETWKVSEPTCSRKQKPLFNYDQEAMKVLHYLEEMSIDDLLKQILPTVFVMAYDGFLCCGPLVELGPILTLLKKFHEKIVNYPWKDFKMYINELTDLIRLSREIETLLTIATSLHHKLPDQMELIERLLSKDQTILLLKKEREVVEELFREREGDFAFSNPNSREFILRTWTPNPHASSRNLIHRLYALLSHNEFRVAEAFSFDVLYF